MISFRAFLVLVFLTIAGYTAVVVAHHGPDLFAVFLRDIASLTWAGQFDLDFMCHVAVSGLWVAYRHRFGTRGVLLGVCATVGGMLFLAPYLLVQSIRTRGDVAALLLGENR